MTEEQIGVAANEYMEIPPIRAAIKCGDIEDLESHIKVAYANGLRDASTWISVNDELPKEDEFVLCRMVSNGAIVGGYVDKDFKVSTNPDFEFEDYGNYKCDYWMPIQEIED